MLGKNIRISLLVSLVTVILAGIFLINSTAVQRSIWNRYVEPHLERMQLSSDFQGFDYIFPNSFGIRPLHIYTATDTLLASRKIEVMELSFSNGWKTNSIKGERLVVNLKALESLLEEGQSSSSNTNFSLAAGEISLPDLQLIGDTIFPSVAINCTGFHYEQGLKIESLQLRSVWDTLQLLATMQSIELGNDSVRGYAHIAAAGFGRLEGTIEGTGEAIVFNGALGFNETNKWLPAEVLEYELPLDYGVQCSLYHFDSLSSTISFNNATISGAATLQGALSTRFAATITTNILEGAQKHFPKNLPTNFIPRNLHITGTLEKGEIVNVDAKVRSNSAKYTLNFKDLESAAFVNAYITETGLTNLEALTFKTALKPNITAVIQNNWVATGVFPKLQFSTHTSRGLSFDLHHNGLKDSIWLSCLDTLLDLEGFVVRDVGDYIMDLEVHAVGLDLFDPLDTGQVISGLFGLNYLENSTGNFSANEVVLQRPNDVVILRSFFAEHGLENGIRSLVVQSDVANGRLVGYWNFQLLPEVTKVILASSYDDGSVKVWPTAKLEGYLRVGEVNWLADLLHLPLTVEAGSTLKWDYNNVGRTWSLDGAVHSGSYDNYTLSGLDVTVLHQGDYFDALASMDQARVNEITIDGLKAESHGIGKNRSVRLLGAIEDSIPSQFTGAFKYTPGSADFEYCIFNIGLDTFKLVTSKNISWNSNFIEVAGLQFGGGAGALGLDGTFTFDEEVSSKATIVAELNARPLNYLIRTPEAVLGGSYATELQFLEDSSLSWTAKTSITGLTFNGIEYGAFDGQIGYDLSRSDIYVQGQLLDGTKTYLSTRGHYNTSMDDLDISLNLASLNVASLNPFFHESIAGLAGSLEGGLQIYGPLNSWESRGEVYWRHGEIEIPLLGAQFAVVEESSISITHEGFQLDSIGLVSRIDQTKALAWGSILHRQLSEFGLDIHLSTDSLLAMNKPRNAEDMFYGRAVAAGTMDLVGPVEQLQLNVQATTKEGTVLKIPMDNPTAVELPSFIRFVDSELPSVVPPTFTGVTDYFSADLGIEVTPEARIELVLDEVLGDIIRAQGSGSMRLKILEDESVELYGVYTVQEGDYLFTLQNIINKQFQLLPGGTISWSGDVYQAELDLKAVYRVQTDLTGLVTSANYNNEKVPVDLIIALSGPLLSPEINFALELPESPASYQQELNRHFLNEEALHYQAFSLLMLGDFFQQNLAIQESINFESSLGNTTSELLVSEFGSWLAAGIGQYVTVDFDYTTGANPLTNFGNQGDNLNLGVSKNFFDGKLKLQSSFDVPIGQEQASTLLLGDTEVTLDISKQGNVVLKAFNRSNRNDPLLQSTGPYTQGVGVQFKKDFNSLTKPLKTDPQ